jgi:hypothetical protein
MIGKGFIRMIGDRVFRMNEENFRDYLVNEENYRGHPHE